MYGALDQFKADFPMAWSAATPPINPQWAGSNDPVRQDELKAQLADFQPITEVFATAKNPFTSSAA